VLSGRYAVSVDDVRALALPVLIHRVVANFHAEADGVSARAIVSHVVESIRPA
jgi:MoxR-like ATPase